MRQMTRRGPFMRRQQSSDKLDYGVGIRRSPRVSRSMVGRARFGTSSCIGRAAIRVPTFYPAGSVSLPGFPALWLVVPGSERLLASVARQYAYPPFIRPDPSVCMTRTPIPLTAGATFRGWGPSVWRRLSARPAVGHSPPGSNPAGSGRIGEARSCVQASLAPVGTRPVSENRQRAMSSLRASATIITRRIRPRAPAVRCSNHSESALSG